ncbi:SAM-dependent methyltransferase [Qingshengfaniella alkalisoli]|uniref:SAM-dependent methyltransferase n=1 Tax=Qingshengfaniella alkalisoli TaxID=2599296 RepID=A0A5B8J411_9RHOB|nr:SAM-dependent methyltransferase [Qingshengfaniella alkalisoli]QDY71448.1 SAM-dependent methyltransferase [Qingshengfaniella alkalisoli]
MSQPRRLTDRNALSRNRARAASSTLSACFLHEQAMSELKERLSEVNRKFIQPAIVTGFPETWRPLLPEARIVADEDVLDLAEGAHDLVIHGLSLHWADDPVGQLIQSRRALQPDGLFLATTFGGRTLQELRATLGQAESEVMGGMSPRVLPMGEIRDLGALLQRAGFALPVADSVIHDVSYRDIFHLMHDLRAMGETNALADRRRIATRRAIFRRAAELYTQSYPADDNRVVASFEIITLTGWAPAPDQPQPLRPGSAVARLSDALGTTETKLKN